MRYIVLLIALWPLVCCDQCDYTLACGALAVVTAGLLFAAASAARELRLLNSIRGDTE